MQSITTTFQQIKKSGRKSGKCNICGKRFTRQKTFSQTQNPFNKNENGDVKSIWEIVKELDQSIAEWYSKPIEQNHCEAVEPAGGDTK